MSRKWFILLGIALSIFHIVLLLGLIITTISFDIDDPNEPTMFQSVGSVVAGILLQPALSLWTPWMSKNLPNACEWFLFLLNSALWGFGFAFLIRFLLKRRKASHIPSPEKSPSS